MRSRSSRPTATKPWTRSDGDLDTGAPPSFGANRNPAAYATLRSVGLPTERCSEFGA
jgi:hypothetical protein